MKFAVTVGKNGRTDLIERAKSWAQQLGVEYLPRLAKGTLQELQAEHELDAMLVATAQGPQLFNGEESFYYHPSMAVLRSQQLQQQGVDNFAQACQLQEGMRFLDCTLGLASDAAIAALICGETGQVIGLEASAPLHFLVQWGLQHYTCGDLLLEQAMRRIQTQQTEALTFLAKQEPDSFDVIYFDPMFKRPVQKSSSMQPLRKVAYQQALTPEHIAAALRLAPRVVIKEESLGVLRALGADTIEGGKYSKLKYGIIRR